MCTYTQLHQVTNQMAQCYHDIYGADIMEQVTDAEIAPAHLRYVRASALAEIACRQAQQGNVVSAYDAALEYFVASQAERNMKK